MACLPRAVLNISWPHCSYHWEFGWAQRRNILSPKDMCPLMGCICFHLQIERCSLEHSAIILLSWNIKGNIKGKQESYMERSSPSSELSSRDPRLSFLLMLSSSGLALFPAWEVELCPGFPCDNSVPLCPLFCLGSLHGVPAQLPVFMFDCSQIICPWRCWAWLFLNLGQHHGLWDWVFFRAGFLWFPSSRNLGKSLYSWDLSHYLLRVG